MTRLSGWGRHPVLDTSLVSASDELDVLAALCEEGVVARGNGRAYGDAAIGDARTLDMRGLNRMLAFDPETGQLVAEAGVLLSDIIDVFLPRGWFPAITPGTRYVTLGGMIAADVHGKNHHCDGSMRTCVDWIDIAGPGGVIRRCSATVEPDLFDHSCGGMGLTGVILRAAIRLRPVRSGWIWQRTVTAQDLDGLMAAFETNSDATYSAAWIDCHGRGRSLGRSLLMLGEHAELDELPPDLRARPFDVGRQRPLSVPLDLPAWTLNGISIRLFNALYYNLGRRKAGQEHLVRWDRYFYPLDAIPQWNRIYGRRGFVQFQCVLPLDRARDGLSELLDRIAASGHGSFLSVLKRLGPQSSAFSFPMAGYTLALDLPASPATFAIYPVLEQVVIAHGGRFYLAKDARMEAQTLRATENRTDSFVAFRTRHGLDRSFASSQSRRLKI